MIGEKENPPAYDYLCKDLTMKHELEMHLVERAEDLDMADGDIFDVMQSQGIFVLVSSKNFDLCGWSCVANKYVRDRDTCLLAGKINGKAGTEVH